MQVTDSATHVRPGEEIDAHAVGVFLKSHINDLEGEVQIRQFPSGFSNLTYLITAGDRQMVLRRPPIGANIKSGHDMGREYRVLSALHPVFPRCPRPLVFTEDESLIGAPFFVMEKLSGIILRKDLPTGLSYSPNLARTLCENLVDARSEERRVGKECYD